MRNPINTSNYYLSTLVSTISASGNGGSFDVADISVDGCTLPTTGFYRVDVDFGDASKREIFRITSRNGYTLTYDRRISPNGKHEHVSGASVGLRDFSELLNYISKNIDNFGEVEATNTIRQISVKGGDIWIAGTFDARRFPETSGLISVPSKTITLSSNSDNYIVVHRQSLDGVSFQSVTEGDFNPHTMYPIARVQVIGSSSMTITDLRGTVLWAGDMRSDVYDPQGVGDDAFDMDNMSNGILNKYVTPEQIDAWDWYETSKQDKLTAGDRITLTGAIISADSQVDDTAYGASWDNIVNMAPSKNALYDKINQLDGQIADINSKIPSAATSANQLADKAFVNSSINSVAAYYITKNAQGDQFDTNAELMSATVFYSGGVQRVPTKNDYCMVKVDETHDNATTRYTYNNGWEYQYTVNETALTQAQLDALNSGITSGKVTTYDGIVTTVGGYGNIVTHNVNEFATSVQGGKADTAVQPGDLSVVATSGKSSDLNNDAGFITSSGIPTDVSSFNNDAGYITGIDSSDVTTALGYTPYDNANPSGYITGIDSSDVTTALGFTPYDSANPSGYINGISGQDVTTALGYTPYDSSNPSGYTTNVGTVTGIEMNGTVVGTGGTIDLGTVVTSHQNIKTLNNNSLVGTGNVSVSEFSPSSSGTTGQILRKTANGYDWDAETGQVSSVNGNTGVVTVAEFSPSNTGEEGQVLKKTSSGYSWSNEGGSTAGDYTAGDGIDISVAHVVSNIKPGPTISANVPQGATVVEGALWYDTTNDLLKAYNGTSWVIVDNPEAFNVKSFTLGNTSDTTTAQAIYDWYNAGKTPILYYGNKVYSLSSASATVLMFRGDVSTSLGTSGTNINIPYVDITVSSGTVTNISDGTHTSNVLLTGVDYVTPYTPQYNGSPSTKKYVDDKMLASIYIGAVAPSNSTEGRLWYDTTNDVLKSYDGANWTQVGGVTSVNTKTGAVTLDADDISDATTTNKFTNATDISRLANTSGTNTGDQSASDFDIKDLTDSTGLRSTWSGKQDALVNQTNIKSINNNSLLGSGDLTINDVKISSSAPLNPTAGILWYDTTTSKLKVYNGTSWDVSAYEMVVLSYGQSTWLDFINAYNRNAIVYCKASSNVDPSIGSQTRMAFMAYYGGGSDVEFQYYRSVSSHTYSHQGDQVFIYKLNSSGLWTVTTREASARVVAGTGLSYNYSNDVLTLSANPRVQSFTTSQSITNAQALEIVQFTNSGKTAIIENDGNEYFFAYSVDRSEEGVIYTDGHPVGYIYMTHPQSTGAIKIIDITATLGLNSSSIDDIDYYNMGVILNETQGTSSSLYKEWVGTQTEYDNLSSYQGNTLYFIVE